MSRKFQVKTIPSRWLDENGRRLDCGPYMSGAMEAKELLANLAVEKDNLQDLTLDGMDGIINAGRIARIWVDDDKHGYPFLSSTDIMQTDLSNLSYIAKSVARMNSKLLIKKDWTLITRSGTIGRMTYARSDMEGMACTEDVLRVIPDQGKIKSGYLYSYLSSEFGVPLIISGTYGSIITHLEPKHISHLPVPRLGRIEDQAHELIGKASTLFTIYQQKIQDATELLFSSVGLTDLETGEWHSWGSDLGFTSTINNVQSLRALNYNPRFLKLLEKIKSKSYKALGEICDPASVKRGGRFLRIDGDPEHSYLMVGQKQIFWTRPEGRWIAKKFIDEELISKPGTTLIAAVGTLADSERYCRSEFIWGKAADRAYSEHFYQVYPNEDIMLPGCLYAFLRSESAFRMLRSISAGTKLQIQKHNFLLDLPIPYPEDDRIRERIHSLIVDAYSSKDLAIECENQAITLVEQTIKEGGR